MDLRQLTKVHGPKSPALFFLFLNFCADIKAALPINVFPVPGGPNSKIPFGGPRKPVNMSLYGESKKQ